MFSSCRARRHRSPLVLERSGVLDWRRLPDSSGAVHRRHVLHVVLGGLSDAAIEETLGQLVDAMDRSVEELGPNPPAWWRRGQPIHLTMATVAEHVAVQEDIASVTAYSAGDEPAAAGKMHIPP